MAQRVDELPRRGFVGTVLSATAAWLASVGATRSGAPQSQPGIIAFDHVAVPLQNEEAMATFYRALGLTVNQSPQTMSVHFGDQKINFHMPTLWQRESFTLRAPAARPPCGDFCFVWSGSQADLDARLLALGVKVEEGPVSRAGGRRGGADTGTSTYVRDPDGNLLEFIIYP